MLKIFYAQHDCSQHIIYRNTFFLKKKKSLVKKLDQRIFSRIPCAIWCANFIALQPYNFHRSDRPSRGSWALKGPAKISRSKGYSRDCSSKAIVHTNCTAIPFIVRACILRRSTATEMRPVAD